MTRSRWATKAGLAAVLVAGAVLPAMTPAPAGANHIFLASLQVTPEISSVQVGATVTLTARFKSTLPNVASTTVNFDFEGGPLASAPNQSCTIAVAATTCTVPVTASVSGSTLVRASFQGGTVDTTEGRLASSAASGTTADCLTPEEGETPAATCRAGDTPAAGATAEPDDTDVVRITWRDRGVDVVPDNQAKARGETATLTASAFNVDGTPAAGVAVKFEFFAGSVSDPAGGNTPATPDRTCTTAANGTCSVNVTQASDGIDLLCAWTSTVTPSMSGTATDSGGVCSSEVLFDVSANDGTPSPIDDSVDVVRILWGSANPVIINPPPGVGTTPLPGSGYWTVASDGGIFAFGDAVFQGSTGALKLNQPVVGMSATATRRGYFLVASDGGIFAFGDAVFRGSTGAIRLNQPIVGMAATPNGGGYFLVAKDGGVFAFGNAIFRGSTGAIRLAQPIVGMDVTPSGNGYFLVAADGGVFAFGDAVFRGSTGAIKLAKPIVGITTTPTGNGYYLVASDGGIFAFGDAVFRGSTGALKLNQPVVGMSRSASGAGYRLVASDGGIFAFGDALFRGSTGAIKLNRPMVGMSGF